MINNDLINLPLQLRFRRFEFKYQVPKIMADKILEDLLNYMEWDPYAVEQPDKSYQVSSLYLDSTGFSCYYEKLAGVKRRKKLRLRTYATVFEPTTKIFLEIKGKDDMVILKDRMVIDYQTVSDWLANGQSNLLTNQLSVQDEEFLKNFLWLKNYNCLLPKIMVVYKRQPLISRLDHKFRITFDSQIRAYPANQLYFSEQKTEILSDSLIMELKYNNTIPNWFHWIIQKYQLDRRPYSKYCQSIAGCHKNQQYV